MAMDENKKNNKGQFLDNFAGKTNLTAKKMHQNV